MARGRALKSRRDPASVAWADRICMLASVLVALGWPALLSDPVHTARQAGLSGQAASLPGGVRPQTEEERAMAIFWTWQHRTLVHDPWVFGPCRGLREAQGRRQVFGVIAAIWLARAGGCIWQRRAAKRTLTG